MSWVKKPLNSTDRDMYTKKQSTADKMVRRNTPSAILKFSFCMSALVRLLLGIGLYLSVFQAASGPLFIPVDFHIFC